MQTALPFGSIYDGPTPLASAAVTPKILLQAAQIDEFAVASGLHRVTSYTLTVQRLDDTRHVWAEAIPWFQIDCCALPRQIKSKDDTVSETSAAAPLVARGYRRGGGGGEERKRRWR